MSTYIINNFSGKLTRIVNGDLNSGYAKQYISTSYDPFTRPGVLAPSGSLKTTFNSSLVNNGIMLRFSVTNDATAQYVYGIDLKHTAAAGYRLYKWNVNGTLIVTFTPGGTTNYGGDVMAMSETANPFGAGVNNNVFFTTDANMQYANLTLTTATVITTFTNNNVPHPMAYLLGLVYVADKNMIHVYNPASNTITLNVVAGIGANLTIVSMRISGDGKYLVMVATDTTARPLVDFDLNSLVGNTYIFRWDGAFAPAATTTAVSEMTKISSFVATAWIANQVAEYLFGYDTLGAAIYVNGQKQITLYATTPPIHGGVDVSDGQIIFAAVDTSASLPYFNQDNASLVTDRVSSVYALGQFDVEIAPSLYRLAQSVGVVGVDTSDYWAGGIKKISNLVIDGPSVFTQPQLLWAFRGNGTLNGGVLVDQSEISINGDSSIFIYETQTQLLGNQEKIYSIQVYLEPTQSGEAFALDLVGIDGQGIGPTMVYRYLPGTNPILMQGPLTRVEFNQTTHPLIGFAVRVFNLSTTMHPYIHQIIIHTVPADKYVAGQEYATDQGQQ